MPGDHGERGAHPPLRHRDAGHGRGGHHRRDARHDLEVDAGAGERERFLATASEDERVAALQAHHPPAVEAELDQQGIDQLLRDGRAGALADVDQLGLGVRQGEDARADERVVDDDLGLLQPSQATDRQQLRIARSGADERDEAASRHLGVIITAAAVELVASSMRISLPPSRLTPYGSATIGSLTATGG